MKSKSFIFFALLYLIITSCDSTILIEVDFSKELYNQNYSLIDYDFVLANSNNSDMFFFEFVTNKELDQSTRITFFDQSGSIIAVKETGIASDLINKNIEISGERSFAYSIKLVNLRSASLVHEVIIGN